MNPLKYLANRKVGLVLGSGGAKGIAHIAVIEYLEELGIPVSMVSGCSIGAIVGAVYCAGRLKEFRTDLTAMDRKALMAFIEPVFPVSGLLEADRMLDFVRKYVPDTLNFEDLKTPLRMVAVDYSTGKPVVFRSGSLIEAIRASISIPGIFQPVPYNDTFLIDGGIVNPLPIDVVRQMGAGLTIAVNLHPALKRRKKLFRTIRDTVAGAAQAAAPVVRPSGPASGIGAYLNILKDKATGIASMGRDLWLKYLGGFFDTQKQPEKKKLPNIIETMFQIIDIMGYSNTVLMLKHMPPTVLIEPDLLHFNSLDFDMSKEALAEGKNACEKVRGQLIRRIKDWI